MNLDIETTVRTIFILLLIGSVFVFVTAWKRYREAQKLYFFMKRQQLIRSVWGLIFVGLIVVIIAFTFNRFSEPIAYHYFSPSPTVTPTATSTRIPTITETPTITLTPSITTTPMFTPNPIMPAAISSGFTSAITPNPKVDFSRIVFSRKLGKGLLPIDPQETFSNPIITLYGSFNYVNMIRGVQWTALWFRDGELIDFESMPWNGETGGYGFTETKLLPEEWLPGRYEVQIFVGETWIKNGSFEVIGDPYTPTPTPTITPSRTPTIAPTFTRTPIRTPTLTLTATVKSTLTSTPTTQITIRPSSIPK